MSNGMPSWEEWKNLTDDAREYSLFKVLTDIYTKQAEQHTACCVQIEKCAGEFEKLKKRKRFDTGIASGSGVIGGIIAWASAKISGILP